MIRLGMRVASEPKVYLAGPEVFLPNAREIGRQKKELCKKYGFRGLYPYDNEVDSSNPTGSTAQTIYESNIALLKSAQCIIANLTPFRSPSADVGTVFELGFMVGCGKPVFGYTNDRRDYLTRVQRMFGRAPLDDRRNAWVDRNGMSVENFGNSDNLMVDMSLLRYGLPIVRCQCKRERRFSDLTGFEVCLGAAANYFRDQITRRSAAHAELS